MGMISTENKTLSLSTLSHPAIGIMTGTVVGLGGYALKGTLQSKSMTPYVIGSALTASIVAGTIDYSIYEDKQKAIYTAVLAAVVASIVLYALEDNQVKENCSQGLASKNCTQAIGKSTLEIAAKVGPCIHNPVSCLVEQGQKALTRS